jgi:hypothetical protein
MKESQSHLRADVPAVKNPAKRYAGQLMGRWVTVMGAGLLVPVARRIKGQINEVAKAGANFEFLPEADHNTLAGLINPAQVLMPHTMTFFLRAPSDLPRHRLRIDMTQKAYMAEGLNTDFMDARGDTSLATMWTLILFGDYTAYYRMACGDPATRGVPWKFQNRLACTAMWTPQPGMPRSNWHNPQAPLMEDEQIRACANRLTHPGSPDPRTRRGPLAGKREVPVTTRSPSRRLQRADLAVRRPPRWSAPWPPCR